MIVFRWKFSAKNLIHSFIMRCDHDLLPTVFQNAPHQIRKSKDIHIVEMPYRIVDHDRIDRNIHQRKCTTQKRAQCDRIQLCRTEKPLRLIAFVSICLCSDIAVVKVDATGLTPATVGDSDNLKVGESVMAVGNPLGELGGTVTSGIVSALNRSVSIQGTSSVNTMSLIQMDASVSPGNSGGGLFNMNGELVGIVNAKSSDSDAEGLGFAIPVNDAVKVAQELLENGYVTGRPYLGISYYAVTDAQTAAQLGVNAYGVYIVEVVKGGPADKAGLQAGDRIVSVDGSEVASQSDLGTLMQNHKAGDTIQITVARGGQMQTVTVTLGEKGAENS